MTWDNFIIVIVFEVFFLIFSLFITINKFKNKFDLYVSMLIYFLYTFWIFMCANWYSINYYMRYATAVVFLAAASISFIRSRKIPFYTKKTVGGRIMAGLNIFVLVVFIYMNLRLACSYIYTEKPIELSFPFKNGIYCIVDGGNGDLGRFMNSHPIIHSDKPDWSKTLKYSTDIVKINSLGFSSKGIFPKKNEDYEIFGENIYSPCDGTVVYAINDNMDNDPFAQYQNGANYLLIHYKDDIYVSLCHMQYGSITVKEGDIVKKGQLIAKAGDSGGTPMPHLHIDAMRLKNPWSLSMITENGMWYIVGKPVPIKYDGRFPVRNMLFIK